MKAEDEYASAKPVLVIVSGSVIVKCSDCGMLVSETFSPNGGSMKCCRCGSTYHYQVNLKANKVSRKIVRKSPGAVSQEELGGMY
jgi:hypothetical protein